MSEDPPVRGLVVTHGSMASGMVDAVRRIAGVGPDALIPISNEGRSPEQLRRAVEEAAGDAPTIVFTDLSTGSCALTARLCCCATETRMAVIFGVNLPLLLDFVFHRDLPLRELVPRLLEKGRESLHSLPDFSAHVGPPVSG